MALTTMERPVDAVRRAAPPPRATATRPGGLLALQRSVGNAAVSALLASRRTTSAGPTAGIATPEEDSRPSPVPCGGVEVSDGPAVQRTIGDGHDLANARFTGDTVLEGCFDNERVLKTGATGTAVSKLQQAMVDLGQALPAFGVDGKFGVETKGQVQVFQRSASVKDDGVVGPVTMTEFDRRTPGGGAPPPPPPPPAPVTITSTTVAAAADGGANTRTRVGPGEFVDLTAPAPVAWVSSDGQALLPGAAVRWTAPEPGGPVTVTATDIATGAVGTLVLTVVPPDSIAMTRRTVLPIPAGSAGADMLTTVDFGHRDVNFSRIGWLEVPGPASGANGYFLAGGGAAFVTPHTPNPAPAPIGNDNRLNGFADHCSSGFPLPPPFFRLLPSPAFFGGSWFWSIPNRYTITGSGSAGTFLVTTEQHFGIDSIGTTTITKQGASIVRTRAGAVT